MDKLISKEDLAILVYCCSLLEEKVAKTYEHIAKVIDNRPISCLFRYIAHDSLKHAEFFKFISEALSGNISISPNESTRACGKALLTLISDAEKILGKSKISLSDLPPLIRGLESIESFAAEEYLTVLYAKLIELTMSEEKIDFGYYKIILEWIVEDEEKHKQMLKIIEGLLVQS